MYVPNDAFFLAEPALVFFSFLLAGFAFFLSLTHVPPLFYCTFVGTSICVSPSGNFLWGGFSDGTLRVFDMHGGFGLKRDPIQASRQKSHMLVASKWHQRFGAVACQIHARGVHTDLLTHVEIAGSYVFAGVQRGAMELYAVSLQELEDEAAASSSGSAVAVVGSSSSSSSSHLHKRRRKRNNILDYLNDVHVHSDAKLKGFGACTLLNHENQNRRPTYLLLTGKGIKNIHIWRFQPPIRKEPAVWEQIYDTQTNGTSINVLAFYRSPLGRLLGISKSDAQNLRLWDLTDEEDETEEPIPEGGSCEKKSRPKRPSYQDVVNSKEALGIAGGFCVCGGPTMYNQLSIVSLDQPKNAFNHTELALPGLGGVSRRQRRGDLKQVVRVATLDDSHALLELDDVSITEGDDSFFRVQYTSTQVLCSRFVFVSFYVSCARVPWFTTWGAANPKSSPNSLLSAKHRPESRLFPPSFGDAPCAWPRFRVLS